MAKTKEQSVETEEVKRTIEAHAKENQISESVVAGIKAMQKWATGKEVTEKEFEAALSAFLESPIGGE